MKRNLLKVTLYLAVCLLLSVQLRQQAAGTGITDAPKVSPFTSVGFFKEMVFVEYEGKTYLWQEIDGIPVAKLVTASKKHFGNKWQKRIREDLVELLWKMDHEPGKTVKLRLQDFDTKKETFVAEARMTEANRRLLWQPFKGAAVDNIANQPTQEVSTDSPTHWSYKGNGLE